jgi:hypothetical protein
MSMRSIAVCAGFVALAGCAGDGTGLDENGRPIGEGGGGGGGLTADFASIQANVFTPICTACHAGAGAPLGLRLEEGASYALLVNAPSSEVPGLLRVNPGDPDSSYLIQKLEGTAAVGGRMPLGGTPLPAETIAVIRQWITEGAQAPAGVVPTSTSLSSAWPVDNAVLKGGSPIVVTSDAALDTTILQAGVLKLYRSGGDGQFAEGNEVDVNAAIELRSLMPTAFAITVPAHEWTADAYQLRISGREPLALTDLSSVAIDGDRDGVAGGDFVLTFKVEE